MSALLSFAAHEYNWRCYRPYDNYWLRELGREGWWYKAIYIQADGEDLNDVRGQHRSVFIDRLGYDPRLLIDGRRACGESEVGTLHAVTWPHRMSEMGDSKYFSVYIQRSDVLVWSTLDQQQARRYKRRPLPLGCPPNNVDVYAVPVKRLDKALRMRKRMADAGIRVGAITGWYDPLEGCRAWGFRHE